MLHSIGKAAKQIGVTTKTLRKWHETEVLVPFKVINTIRYYSDEQLEEFKDTK